MAYRDYDEGRSGPGGGYEDRDRMDREGGRGWMDRAREYFDRARDAGRDLYERERERAQADRYGRGAPGYDRGDRYDRGFDGPGGRGAYDAGYGGSRDRDYGHERGNGRAGMEGGFGARSAGSMGGNSYVGEGRPDLGDRNPGQGFAAGGGAGGSYYGQGASSGTGGGGPYGGRQSYAGRGSKNYRRSDARIEEEVHEVLTRHHEIDATDVDVRVENGEVTLTGEVEDRRTKRLVEDIVEQLSGVRDVHNQIKARRGLLGAVASAAMDAVDPDRPSREATAGATRQTVAGSGTSPSIGGTGTTTGATTGFDRPGTTGPTGGPTDTGMR